MDGLLTIVWFIVALGVLVTFHEFGHYYVARRCGVRVLRFSVGFGKPLLTWRDRRDTEFVLAAIPLGGYVKMLDEREGEVAPEDLDQAFTRKSVWQRIAIVAAGPIANFLLAIVLFWGQLLPGSTDVIPIVGAVETGSLAEQAGLEPGQEILAVDGMPTPTWTALNRQLLQRLGETGSLKFTVKYPDSNLNYESEVILEQWLRGAEEPDPMAGIGLTLQRPPVVIDTVESDSPAARAGLQPLDRIVSADGKTMNTWSDWVTYVRAHPEQTIDLIVERSGRQLALAITPAAAEGADGEAFGRVGVGFRWPEELLRETEYTIAGAFTQAVDKTWETSVFVLASVKKLILGQISTKNLSGPITIAKVAGASAKAGWVYYLGFLGLLSVSLGVFNLLPIPVLDGGHLLYYLVEAVKGSPVSERVQMIGYQLGLCVIVGVMVLAFYNDIMRLG
ncbi:RIP metalloprotease RseP [Exilibacterium tricleocarpae]|uniref:Zinc metalloprotease n=1 Tax=Exilibacterium tricleocarpae TaxID=2591008 RepID=A0A545U8G8_9GAMM|nr:RIP metalloprotease RseP [Exilibacterium tricleocarpae]TQV85761.1 RIP metalloprotease RseP [Exilibacterium tricleocarpae]